MSAETKIIEAMEALHAEGVDMSDLGGIEARLISLLYKARRLRNAESMLPLLGAEITAERLGCCRKTVYNLAKRARKKCKNIPTTCTS
jgi:predicted amino acid dehydrogenase